MKWTIKKVALRALVFTVALTLLVKTQAASSSIDFKPVDFKHGLLRVSENGRYLVHADGTPFFWLGDTAWELFHRLNREDAERYLENRRQKKFTVIQAVVLSEFYGLDAPNAYGDLPLVNRDPLHPNQAYFRHVDWIVKKAQEKGLVIAMLPTWGSEVVRASWEKTPPQVVFNPQNAHAYGRWLAARYKKAPNLIWVLGGDRDPHGVEDVWRAMAAGLREGDGGRHLITFHPPGGQSSSKYLHSEKWLAFNMVQSSHSSKDLPNYRFIEHDYQLTPVKPVLDGEPRYEDHPVNWDPEHKGWFDAYDVRQAAYWAVFAGAFGHTYGCHAVWQMLEPGRPPLGLARHNWKDDLDLPGATQMQYVRMLMESRPFLSRVPDQSLVLENVPNTFDHVQATRGDGYAFFYIPGGKPIHVQLGKISGYSVHCWWYDPRTGHAQDAGIKPNRGEVEFSPPGSAMRGNDWVLVLDDQSKNFPPPGTRP